MAKLTGTNGNVKFGGNDIVDVKRWEITREAEVKTFVSSDSGGYQKVVPGAKRWSGRFEMLLEDGSPNPGVEVGDSGAGLFYLDASHTLGGTIVIQSIEVSVDIDGSEIEGATVSFVGDGAFAIG